jgi:hypothetical protein
MLSGIKRLTNSSAAIVLGLAVIGVIVMNVAGRVDGPTALDFIKWLVTFFFAKIAVEDAAAKIAAAKMANAEPGDESRERSETPSRAPTMKIKIDELIERSAQLGTSKEVK